MTLMAAAVGILAAGAAFDVGIELPSQAPVEPGLERALEHLGIDYVNFYTVNGYETVHTEAQVTEAMVALCERLGLKFSLACHHLDPSPESIDRALQAGPLFQGIVVDELGHVRLQYPEFSPPSASPMLADAASFTSLEEAHAQSLEGFRRLHDSYRAAKAPAAAATHIWPSLLHMAAQAGFIPCPKICKELYSPISLAIGMGAAIQYGRPLWVDCDLWYFHLAPGHPPEELRANLLLAYWMGADRVYVEGSGYNLLPAGMQGVPFSLVNLAAPGRYQLTPHGEVLRAFCREYVPANPRPHAFRDVKPEAAIIRFDDTDIGQGTWWAKKLFGSEKLPPNETTSAWLSLWNVLTWGASGTDGLAYFKIGELAPKNDTERHHITEVPSYASQPEAAAYHSFFCPLNGVVVFDHQVEKKHIQDIPVLFVTGTALSEAAAEAIRECVGEGAAAIVWHELAGALGLETAAPEEGPALIQQGQGKFVITRDFADPDTVAHYEQCLYNEDTIRYRFGTHTLELRKVNANEVSVHLTPESAQ